MTELPWFLVQIAVSLSRSHVTHRKRLKNIWKTKKMTTELACECSSFSSFFSKYVLPLLLFLTFDVEFKRFLNFIHFKSFLANYNCMKVPLDTTEFNTSCSKKSRFRWYSCLKIVENKLQIHQHTPVHCVKPNSCLKIDIVTFSWLSILKVSILGKN